MYVSAKSSTNVYSKYLFTLLLNDILDL